MERPVRLILIGLACLTAQSCIGLEEQPSLFERGSWQPLHHTVKELRDLHVVKQKEDFSCGAAALSTLLTYYFGDVTTEKEVLRQLESQLTKEEREQKQKRGFSLLDLKGVAEAKGYRAGGFKLRFSQLAKLQAPAIVFLEPNGYKHFAVYRGMDRGRIYLADPSRGNLKMSIGRFLDEWRQIIFVLQKETGSTLEDHPLKVPNPFFIQPELARFTTQLDIGVMLRALPTR